MKSMKEIYDDIYLDSLTPLVLPDGKIKAYSDKNTNHSYIDHVYEQLFRDIKSSTKKILEIGIYGGGSMLLWKEYFQNAHVYGLDISYYVKELAFQDRITQIIGDAYSDQVVSMFANNEFDIVIDDGPHTLESFRFFIQRYLPKVREGGYLIIEDVYDTSIIAELISCVPKEYAVDISLHDLRQFTNLYDDIVIVLRKKNS